MMEDGTEGNEIEGFFGAREEGFDGLVEEGGRRASEADFAFQDGEHVGRDVHHGDAPAAAEPFQGDIAGAAAAIEATDGIAAFGWFGFDNFQIVFDPALEERAGGAS